MPLLNNHSFFIAVLNVEISECFFEQNEIFKLAPLKANPIGPNQVRVLLWHHTFDTQALIQIAQKLAPNILNLNEYSNFCNKRIIEKLSTRILLSRLLVENYFQLDYHTTGRPYLLHSPYYISISHTQNTFAVSISFNRHGIDIEQWSEKPHNIASMFINSQDYIPSDALTIDITRNYTTLWSTKEAVYKLVDIPGLSLKHDITAQTFKNGFAQINNHKLQSTCKIDYSFHPHFVLTIAHSLES